MPGNGFIARLPEISLRLKQPLWPELKVLQRKIIFYVLEILVHETNLDVTHILNMDKTAHLTVRKQRKHWLVMEHRRVLQNVG